MPRSEKPPGRLAIVLVNALAYLYIVFGTFFFAMSSVLLGWIGPRGNMMFRLSRPWSRGLLASSGVRLDAEFEVPLDPERSYVYLANHQSYFDIPALMPVAPGQVRFAAKRSLFRIPVFGWSLWVGGFIPIDREEPSKATQAFSAAAERVRQGASVLFFPEGTRSADGKLAPFQRGGFLIALKAGLPIVPVGIEGARQVMPRGRVWVTPGRITVRFGTPLDCAAYGVKGRGRLMADVRRKVAELARIEMADETL
jgi:1-acyl-sn-glycerol-3-phosphate acyltransferase